MKTLSREELCTRYVSLLQPEIKFSEKTFDLLSSLLTLLPFRWKQHEAYIQVLETKYADLCCKYICRNSDRRRDEVRVDVSSLMHCLCVFHFVAASANDMTGLKESDEKLKQQQQESARRENILVMRLATKEQEMQECTVCI